MPLDFRLKSSSVSYTSHAASYTTAGWKEGGIEIASPWLSLGFGGGSSTTTQESSIGTELWVTGRWSYTMCRLLLPSNLAIHNDYQDDIDRALQKSTPDQKRLALQKVFNHWGLFFVAGMEMGAVQYIESHKKTDEKVCRLPVHANTNKLMPLNRIPLHLTKTI
jgi:hypothetical protein